MAWVILVLFPLAYCGSTYIHMYGVGARSTEYIASTLVCMEYACMNEWT